MRSAKPLACEFLEPLLKERNTFASLTDAVLELDQIQDKSHVTRETYSSLLRQCSSAKSIYYGKRIHSHILQTGRDGDTLLGNFIVQMYARCGCMDEARAAFDRITRPNVFSWNVMLAGYAQNGDPVQARRLFQRMPEWNSSSFSILLPVLPIHEARTLFTGIPVHDVVSWNALLAAYAQNGYLEAARRMFNRMPERSQFSWTVLIRELASASQPDSAEELFWLMPLKRISLQHMILVGYSSSGNISKAETFFESIEQPDMVSCNVMITAYATKGHPERAKAVFDRMLQRDVVSWNSLVTMAIKNGGVDLAGNIFDRMPQQNVITASALLYAYTQQGHVEPAKKIFNEIPERNLFPWNTLLSAFVRDEDIPGAEEFFHKMPGWDVVSWSTLVAAYAKNGYSTRAKDIFDTMPCRSIMSWNAMISGYSLSGGMSEAVPLFERMPMRDLISWTSMVSGFAQNGNGSSALDYFRWMEIEGMRPEESTYVSVLDACASLADVFLGKLIHDEIKLDGEDAKATVAGSLVNMYAKCGYLVEARSVFDTMTDRSAPSWNTMIAGYAQNGYIKEALDMFRIMEQDGTVPTFISYIVVLTACSHLGDVELAAYHLAGMKNYGIEPVREHYMCMVDLLSRLGKVETAHEFVNLMPVEMDAAALLMLLTGCKNQGVVRGAEQAAEHLFKLEDKWSAPYVLLSNLHAEGFVVDTVKETPG